ncbi:hypothetical protein FPJ27_37270 (plasmid) [Burkholderia sp. MS455]|uniref:contractile injection system tape measure protein n=1 Tax=Burkholderia sp. MS455 TaxID=2811788 RepID=UPI00195B4312|nr:contractile injection system tape measure protein [Burkholderia sp. MS455]QRR11848.1 hypothetical protein FPJ27_37270 [Burkholderia sp. MS455]
MKQARVGQIRFRLHTSEQQAEPVQHRCSAWFHDEGRAPLATLLTGCAQEHESGLSIDRLTLEVGEIALSRFETEMSERVMKALAEQLQRYRQAVGTDGAHRADGTSSRAGWYARTNDAESGATRDGEGEAMTGAPSSARAAATFAQLLRYLDTGYMTDTRPWSTRETRERWLVTVLEATAQAPVAETTAPPQVELALRMLQPRARQRLVSTWSARGVSSLIGWLIAPMRLPIPTQPDGERLLPLAALIALQQHPEAAAHYEPVLWTVSLPSVPRASAASRASTDGAIGMDTASLAERPNRAGTSHVSGRPQPVTGATPGDAHPAPSDVPASSPTDPTLDTWLDTLLRTPLSAPLRAQLHAWLLEPVRAGQKTPRVANLSAPVRQRLRAVLGLPAPRTTLHVSRAGAPPADRSDTGTATGGAPHATRSGSSPAEQHATRLAPDARAPESTPRTRPVPTPDAREPWAVSNAGLVLLWPLLPSLFAQFGWVEDGQFVDDAARWQALSALDWLAWGDPELAEWRTPFSRLLCGIAWDAPFDADGLEAEQQAALDTWLAQMFGGVPTLNRCSVGDLRGFFLQRPGMLVDDERVSVAVEADATDVLLRGLPWPLTQVMLPWLPAPIEVDWIS